MRRVVFALVGIVAVAAASPASADQLSTAKERVPDFMFFQRHIVFQMMGLTLMIGLSFLDRDQARRLGILVGAVMLALLFVVPVIGEEKNGARRWINVGMSLQPSEFLKPGFAIICAWVLSWRLRDPGLPDVLLASGWPGQRARLLCRELYRRLLVPSERHVDAHLRLADGRTPEASSRLVERFQDADPLRGAA